ncbi:uroporphyrinogen-III synthase [Falsiroseomonas selenitidurans]|uniref:Uroporphyrinogen-III synthase n=1 Tax=Falsiroseomonas selenitidurans TaxID=2716335 RepID=A0ABX1EBS2_9PROT|nr:uroporphyrinogen-III synthase [Falsiroseomonas selenitidurans]NKC32932.1 uroporphyrinogen-III synthase [Falsiroseomonas selenitidurans]
MPPPVPGVLVTRPEPGGGETAARLLALGFRPVLAPALVLVPRPLPLPPCQAVLVTSRAAARALPAPPPGLPLLAVGEATAAAARAAGWPALVAAGTAADLARLAAARLDPAAGPLLLAVGQGYAQDLAAALRGAGFRVLRRIAYAAHPATTLPSDAAAAIGGVRFILFHSPRSARCAITLFREAGQAATLAGMEALVLSRRVAEAARAALAPVRWRALRVAARPTEDALLALLGPGAFPGPGAGEGGPEQDGPQDHGPEDGGPDDGAPDDGSVELRHRGEP